MYGVEHVLQSIGSVGIVHYSRVAFRRLYRFQTSAHAVKCAHSHEHVLLVGSEHNGSAVYCEQIADIELANELYTNLMTVHLKVHSLEVALDDACLEIGCGASGISLHLSLGVLHHHHTVLVISVGYGESCLGQTVEESLLSVAIVLESLVIVEVVACEVGEYASCEAQSSDTLLCYGV